MIATLEKPFGQLAAGERYQYVLPDRAVVWGTGADVEAGVPACLDVSIDVGRGVRKALRYYYVCRDSEVDHLVTWIEPLSAWGYDCETSGISVHTEQVATLQFGNPLVDDPRAYTVDWRCLSESGRNKLRRLIADRKRRKIGANLKFEALYSKHRCGVGLRGVGWDTQVAEMVVRAGLLPGGNDGSSANRRAYGPVGMAKVSQRYLELDIDKDHDLRTSFFTTPKGEHTPRQIVYANGDTIYPFYIAEEQKLEVDARGLRNTLKVEFELIPILAEMELRGMRFNKTKWIKLWQDAVEAQDKAERELDALILNQQGSLFDTLPDVPGRACELCGGSGTRERGFSCVQCHGTGRIRTGAVRPLYMGKKSPESINYGSSTQVRWLVKYYCEQTAWPLQVLTTPSELRKVKARLGLAWLLKRGKLPVDADGIPTRPPNDEELDGVPDYVVPETGYCILLDADWKTLELRRIRGQLPTRLVELLVEYADQKAKLGTFGKDFLKHVHPDGRVRFEFHQLIASTGRLSASPNGMAIPQGQAYRDSFEATPGFKLCIADYSQQEPRTSAYVSKDPVYLKNYEVGDDLYLTVAEAMLGYRPDPDSSDPEFAKRSKRDRKAIKAVVLGMAYRMGAGKLRDSLTLALDEPVSFEEAAQLHKTFLEKCAGIKLYQELCHSLADPQSQTSKKLWDVLVDGPVTWIASPCGRKRFFPQDALGVYTESCNMPIQGCGATMTKTALVLIQRWIDEHDFPAYPVNCIHDEIIYECETTRASEFALVMQAKMEEAGRMYVPDVTIVASFPKGTDGTCDRWLKE
jgi:DNA polymerase I-like protein with 3'-5' exonuclease and polymerase domains